jgi:hypothetical protein
MKAIVAKMAHDGSYRKVGMIDRFITGDYLTLEGLLRYGIPAYWKQFNLHIEVYADRYNAEPIRCLSWNAETKQLTNEKE